MKKKDWYTLTRQWFDFTFENPDLINTNHTALYFYIVDQRNRFWQKDKFWLPTLFTMEALSIRSKNTYYKIFNDLVSFWFIQIIQKSINQNTSNIIRLNNSANSKNKSALDLASIQHVSQHVSQQEFSGGNIDKQVNKETNKQGKKETSPPKIKTLLLWELENVKLTQKQLDQLYSDYEEKDVVRIIWNLSVYDKLHTYKDHNKVIRTWLRKDNKMIKSKKTVDIMTKDELESEYDKLWRDEWKKLIRPIFEDLPDTQQKVIKEISDRRLNSEQSVYLKKMWIIN